MEVKYDVLLAHSLQQAVTVGIVMKDKFINDCLLLDEQEGRKVPVGEAICLFFGRDTIYCDMCDHIAYV